MAPRLLLGACGLSALRAAPRGIRFPRYAPRRRLAPVPRGKGIYCQTPGCAAGAAIRGVHNVHHNSEGLPLRVLFFLFAQLLASDQAPLYLDQADSSLRRVDRASVCTWLPIRITTIGRVYSRVASLLYISDDTRTLGSIAMRLPLICRARVRLYSSQSRCAKHPGRPALRTRLPVLSDACAFTW